MSKSTTTVTREFDEKGNCIKEVTVVEDDSLPFSEPTEVPELPQPSQTPDLSYLQGGAGFVCGDDELIRKGLLRNYGVQNCSYSVGAYV